MPDQANELLVSCTMRLVNLELDNGLCPKASRSFTPPGPEQTLQRGSIQLDGSFAHLEENGITIAQSITGPIRSNRGGLG